jgi:hypothetical protein
MAVAYQEGNNLTGQTLKSFDEFEESSPSAPGTTTDKTQLTEEKAGDTSSSPDDIEYEDIPLHSHGIRWRRYGTMSGMNSNPCVRRLSHYFFVLLRLTSFLSSIC